MCLVLLLCSVLPNISLPIYALMNGQVVIGLWFLRVLLWQLLCMLSVVLAYVTLMDICTVNIFDKMCILRFIQLTSHLDINVLCTALKRIHIFLF